MAFNITSDELLEFAARKGNKIVAVASELKAPLVSALDKEQAKGFSHDVNIIAAASNTVAMLGDGEDLPEGGAQSPYKGRVKPKAIAGVFEIGEIAMNTLTGEGDSIDFIKSRLTSVGESIGVSQGQGMFSSGKIVDITAFTNFSSGVGTVTVASFNGLKVGQLVELYDGYTGGPPGDPATRAFKLTVGALIIGSDAGGTVTLLNNAPGASSLAHHADSDLNTHLNATGCSLYRAGSWTNVGADATPVARDKAATSLSDLAGTGAIYDLTAAEMQETGFYGTTFDCNAAVPSDELFGLKLAQIQGQTGDYPDLVVGNRLTANVLGYGVATSAGQLGSWNPTGGVSGLLRRSSQGKLDKNPGIGKNIALTVAGVPFLVDNNCSPLTAFAINTEFLKIAEWKPIEQHKQGGDGALINQTKYGRKMIFSTIYNLICSKRNSVVKFDDISASVF